MYEMEGALPGRAVPGQPVAWPPARRAARWCRAPAPGTGFPIPLTFPELPPGRGPFPTVKVFLLRRRTARKGLQQNKREFFAIHILFTELSRFSAVSDSYPLAFAQLFHRLPMVIRGIPWPPSGR